VDNRHLGERLRQERKRLGLSQEAFAERAKVSRTAQTHYELGKTPPDINYMARIGEAGADVTYILSGRRSGEVAGDLLDWELHDAILRGIRELAIEEDVDISFEKEMSMLKLLYGQFAKERAVDHAALRTLFKLAA
jgi:transcriptional regulator with XRE-family HTH domain